MTGTTSDTLYFPIAEQSVGAGAAAKVVRGVPGAALTMIRVEVPEGFHEQLHSHVSEQMMFVISGRMRVVVPGHEPVSVGPGEFFHFTADLPHEAFAEEHSVLVDGFAGPARNEILQPPSA